ncbi:innexin inx2-like [Tropilaelaps mercedesae]|uniref:Innexin n=1 Tax=Tropilaelaps mercedesae TaxID=418985 RepID=A0A1V9Y2L1_9ACAR|nr:innexin inx2-like [Tropilaelaps mercedesae]
MTEVLYQFKSLFKTEYITIDNNVCRLHYKATIALLLACSALVTAKQYFGDPIDCVVPKDSINVKMLDTYCWIHKTFSVEKAFKGDLGNEVAYPGVAPHKNGDKLVYHAYYQWVCFVLFLQAGAFYLPRFIWKLIEGNRIKHLSADLRKPLLNDDKKRRVQLQLLVDYMEATRLRGHVAYFGSMVAIELLNFINIVLQIYLIDWFLGGEFSNYGWRTATFTEWHWEARYDPMIKVFPRMAKCTFRMYGTSGDIQKLDAVCVLPINILNEKIYVILWFWLVGLTLVTALWLVFRAATILVPSLRERLLLSNVCKYDTEAVNAIRYILREVDVGDWFIMYQVSKNIDPLHMAAFVKKLRLRFTKEFDPDDEPAETKTPQSATTRKLVKLISEVKISDRRFEGVVEQPQQLDGLRDTCMMTRKPSFGYESD